MSNYDQIFIADDRRVYFDGVADPVCVRKMLRRDFHMAQDHSATEDDLLAACCVDEAGKSLGWTRSDIDRLPVDRWQLLMRAFNSLHGEPE